MQISQRILKKYLQLEKDQKKIKAKIDALTADLENELSDTKDQFKALKEKIIERANDGELFEDGPLIAKVTEGQGRATVSWKDEYIEAMSEEDAKDIMKCAKENAPLVYKLKVA